MELDSHTIAHAAQRLGVKPEELAAVVRRGASVQYKPASVLFHESAPREWFGLVMEGEIKLIRGQQGQNVVIGVAQPGAIISEGVMLDESPHSTTAVTYEGARVWQIS